MLELDNKRQQLGILGSVLVHGLVFGLIVLTELCVPNLSHNANYTEIAIVGDGGGGGGGGGSPDEPINTNTIAPTEETSEKETTVGSTTENPIYESTENGSSPTVPSVKKGKKQRGHGSGTGSGGGHGTGQGTGTGSGAGPGTGSGSGGGHGSGHGTGNGSGVGPGSSIASNPAIPPRPTGTVAPYYPPALKEAGVEGVTVLQLIIGTTGRVESAALARSCGNSTLDNSAIAAVRQWSFSPARNTAGQKVRCYFRLPIRFKINYN